VFGGWFDGLGCGVGPDVVDGVAVAACEEAAESSVWGAEDLGPGDGDTDGQVRWGWRAHWAASSSALTASTGGLRRASRASITVDASSLVSSLRDETSRPMRAPT